MENHSLLPQRFSFVNLPREIRVLTDNGTGNILPGEQYKVQVEYRPTLPQTFEENFVYVRFITGDIQSREVKVPYVANVVKCPLTTDKAKIEFPALPENENKEIVLELKNSSQKNLMVELVPPNFKLSGLIVNPLVAPLAGGKSTLVSVKYVS